MNNKKKTQLIKVFIRPRPLNKEELENNEKSVILRTMQQTIVLRLIAREKQYRFEQVFRETTPQSILYQTVVEPMISSLISGINCTLFTYGQTGTGKTYTLSGKTVPDKYNFILDESVGVIPRAAINIFEELRKLQHGTSYTVRASFIEIYNEEVRDLLLDAETAPSLMRIYDDVINKGSVKIMNMTEITVLDHFDIFKCLQIGTANRQTAATHMNKQSSRSHAVFTITVNTRETTMSGEEVLKCGKLNLVDLAGSENIGRSKATDTRAKETANINKSLLTLGKVILSLAKHHPHVPYRESKLTRILQDSLGGNTKTSMIATISPSNSSWEETVSTLEYATITQGIENCPQVNENRTHSILVQELREEIQRLQKELDVARSGQGFYITHENYNQLNEELKDRHEKIKVLSDVEGTLVSRIEELSLKVDDIEDEKRKLSESFEKTNKYKEFYERDLKIKNRKLREDKFLLNYLEERDNKVTDMATNLLNLYKTSSKHEEILHNKYEMASEKTSTNAEIAQQLYLISHNGFEQIEKTTNTFCHGQIEQIDDLSGIAKQLTNLNHSIVNQQKNQFRSLNDESQRIQNTTCGFLNEEFTVDGNDKNLSQHLSGIFNENEFESDEEFNRNLTDFQQYYELKKAQWPEIIEQCDKAINDLNIKTSDYLETEKKFENEMMDNLTAIKQSLDRQQKEQKERNEKFLQLMQSMEEQQNKQFQEQTNEIQLLTQQMSNRKKDRELYENRNCCNRLVENYETLKNFTANKIETENELATNLLAAKESSQAIVATCKEKSMNVFRAFANHIEGKLTQHNNIAARNIGEIAEGTKAEMDLVNKLDRNIGDFTNILESSRSSHSEYLAKIKVFNEQANTNIRNIYRNVQRATHNGDTPVKRTQEVPTSVDRKFPLDELRNRFSEEAERLDDSHVSIVDISGTEEIL